MFIKKVLDVNLSFNDVAASVKFENTGKGRQCAVLVDSCNPTPIVRTTTKYTTPVQLFNDTHTKIIKAVQDTSNIKNLQFNNACIEIYDTTYYKMGFHTDQSLDLHDDSYICLFSCYEDDSVLRTLKIKNKQTDELSEIKLDNCSIVMFSTSTNQQYLHKIVLEQKDKAKGRWIGVTFRLSKTFVTYKNDQSYINDKVLRVATDKEFAEFCKHKGEENSSINYKYPETDYTISVSDTLL